MNATSERPLSVHFLQKIRGIRKQLDELELYVKNRMSEEDRQEFKSETERVLNLTFGELIKELIAEEDSRLEDRSVFGSLLKSRFDWISPNAPENEHSRSDPLSIPMRKLITIREHTMLDIRYMSMIALDTFRDILAERGIERAFPL